MPQPLIDMQATGGLICGFVLRPGRAPEEVVAAPAAMPDFLEGCDASIWLHFNLADMRAQHWIRACPVLPDHAKLLLTEDDTHIRFARMGDGVGGVLGDLQLEYDNDPSLLDRMRLFCNCRMLITGRFHPIKATDQLRRELLHSTEPIPDAPLVLARLVGDLANLFDDVANQLSDKIDQAEDEILEARHLEVSESLGRIHRTLARLRRHVGANRAVLARMTGNLPPAFSERDASHITQSVEQLEAVVSELSLLEDRARLLESEIARRVNESTNRNLFFVSIVTAIFLPATLISGIFGMNVPGLPWLESVRGFWNVIVLMLLTVLTTVLVLRWRRIF